MQMKALIETNTTFRNPQATVNSLLPATEVLPRVIQSLKGSIFAEFRSRPVIHKTMLALALNEAEALADETEFPLLVFPALAREKAEAVAAWSARNAALQNQQFIPALAA